MGKLITKTEALIAMLTINDFIVNSTSPTTTVVLAAEVWLMYDGPLEKIDARDLVVIGSRSLAIGRLQATIDGIEDVVVKLDDSNDDEIWIEDRSGNIMAVAIRKEVELS